MGLRKEYLGDSSGWWVYATFDGFCVTLTTENEDDVVSNTIVLEPAVIVALERLIAQLGRTCLD